MHVFHISSIVECIGYCRPKYLVKFLGLHGVGFTKQVWIKLVSRKDYLCMLCMSDDRNWSATCFRLGCLST